MAADANDAATGTDSAAEALDPQADASMNARHAQRTAHTPGDGEGNRKA